MATVIIHAGESYTFRNSRESCEVTVFTGAAKVKTSAWRPSVHIEPVGPERVTGKMVTGAGTYEFSDTRR